MNRPVVAAPPPAPPGAAPLSLGVNFSWNLAGYLAFTACQGLVLVVLAQLGDPAMVGRYSLAMAVVAPWIALASLRIRLLLSLDAGREAHFRDYLATKWIALAGALAVVAGIAFAGYAADVALTILLVGAARALFGLADNYYGYQQLHERMDRVAISMIVKGVLTVAAFAAAIALTGNLLVAATAWLAVNAALLLAYDVPACRRIAAVDPHAAEAGRPVGASGLLLPRWRGATQRRILGSALPLGAASLLEQLYVAVPIYFLAAATDEDTVGLYGAMAYLVLAGQKTAEALMRSASPRLAKHFSAGAEAAYRSLLFRLLVVLGSLGVAGAGIAALFGRPVLSLLYGAEYGAAIPTFLLLVAAGVFACLNTILEFSLASAHFYRAPMAILAATVPASVLLCALLVPDGGLRAAAGALAASAALRFVLSLLAHRPVLRALANRAAAVASPDGAERS